MPFVASGEQPKSLKGHLELRDVSFAYPQRLEVAVFSHLNLTVEAGTTVALVGPSGSGKSTIVGLVQRFYDPTAGTVSMDGDAYMRTCLAVALGLRWGEG